MTCPFCKKPMEKGSIIGVRWDTFPWIPEEGNRHWFNTEKNLQKEGGINLCHPKFDGVLECYICRKCRKGIFEIT